MTDNAYDISYLIDAEPARVEMPTSRVVAVPAPKKPSQAEVQEAIARELMQACVIHEAMVQQFLRTFGPVDEALVQR